jgi:hypothetical protein
MEKVNSLQEAQEWFANHTEGSVICVKAEEKEVASLADAEAFYGTAEKTEE